MAITTQSGLNAALIPGSQIVTKTAVSFEATGIATDGFFWNGKPAPSAVPAMGLNGTALSGTVAGQIPIPAAVGGENIHIAEMTYQQPSDAYTAIVMDRLWHNSGIVVATLTAQAITHPGLPARDQDGTSNGNGIMAALVATAATTNASPITNTTISYTNQAGTSGRTGTITSWPGTALINTFVPFNLQAGDTGVRSIQSITLGTSYVAGSLSLVMYREMCSLGAPAANVSVSAGPIQLGMPRVFDSSVLFPVFVANSAGNKGQVSLTLRFAQG